jgi:hypothetical protein
VEIKDNSKGIVQSTKTDRGGVYQFFFLAPAKYTLTVTHEGFRTESRAVNVLLGPPGTVNVTLEIAKASSEIRVTDEVPLLQAENGIQAHRRNRCAVQNRLERASLYLPNKVSLRDSR